MVRLCHAQTREFEGFEMEMVGKGVCAKIGRLNEALVGVDLLGRSGG